MSMESLTWYDMPDDPSDKDHYMYDWVPAFFLYADKDKSDIFTHIPDAVILRRPTKTENHLFQVWSTDMRLAKAFLYSEETCMFNALTSCFCEFDMAVGKVLDDTEHVLVRRHFLMFSKAVPHPDYW